MEDLFVPLAFLAFPVALAVVAIAIAWRTRAGAPRRRILLGFGITLIALPVAFFVMMLTGETIAELGWGRGLAMIGPWALAAVAFLLLAWMRPQAALWLFGCLAVIPLGFGVWSMVDAVGFGAWLDEVGPLNLVATYLLIAATTVVALRRPWPAGVLIAIVAGVPAVLPLLVAGAGQSREWIIAALSAPPLVAAALMMLAGSPAFVDREGGRGSHGSEDPGPRDRERALGPEPRRMDPAL